MTAEVGLRERKKRATRQLIAEAAFALFAEHGFDRVSVAAIARGADVSEATVFNYFRTKEDLVFRGLEQFETALVSAVRDRPAGQSIVAAFGGFLTHQHGLLGSLESADVERLAAVNRIIRDSAALRARERQLYDDYAGVLAGFLAEEAGSRGGDVRPWVVANALIGVHRAIVEYVRGEVLAGRTGAALLRRVRAHAERALTTLDDGIRGYPNSRARTP